MVALNVVHWGVMASWVNENIRLKKYIVFYLPHRFSTPKMRCLILFCLVILAVAVQGRPNEENEHEKRDAMTLPTEKTPTTPKICRKSKEDQDKTDSDKHEAGQTTKKTNQECDSWFDLDGNTSDATAYQQIKSSGYTKANAPAAVKNQIAIGVAKCNQKYLIARPINQTTPDTSKSPAEANKSQQNESKDHPVSFFGKVANGVTQFFSNFRDGANNSNSSKHTCSPGEILMHSNEC